MSIKLLLPLDGARTLGRLPSEMHAGPLVARGPISHANCPNKCSWLAGWLVGWLAGWLIANTATPSGAQARAGRQEILAPPAGHFQVCTQLKVRW